MKNDNGFEERLRTALQEDLTPSQRLALDSRIRTTVERGGAPARRLAVRPLALVVVLVAVLSSAGAVTAVGLLRESSESPYGLVDARAFRTEIEIAAAELPLPPNAAWPTSLTAAYPVGSYARGGGAAVAGYTAFCLWVDAWLGAEAADDERTLGRAAETLVASRGWEPYIGIFGDDSYRDLVDVVIAAAVSGERAPIVHYRATNCAGSEA
ncbi:MAG: hypothetical protein M3473_05430 [Chloroflexota bacterium]|nr:hypothetical protein [Chloroflexota bacterium]